MYGLLTKCEVKMAGYWPSSFFACLWTETGKFFLRDTAGSPERARLLHLARSGSQSQRRIWFILSTHGASHIIIQDNRKTWTYYLTTLRSWRAILFQRLLPKLGSQAHFNTMCFSFAVKMAADTNQLKELREFLRGEWRFSQNVNPNFKSFISCWIKYENMQGPTFVS